MKNSLKSNLAHKETNQQTEMST